MPSVLDGFAQSGKASLTSPRAVFDRKYNAYPGFPLNAEIFVVNYGMRLGTCRATEFDEW